MIRAVLSFLLRPLNAASSVLLKMHSLFLASAVHPLTLLHVQHLYLQSHLFFLDLLGFARAHLNLQSDNRSFRG